MEMVLLLDRVYGALIPTSGQSGSSEMVSLNGLKVEVGEAVGKDTNVQGVSCFIQSSNTLMLQARN
jgi:hypothetical protein